MWVVHSLLSFYDSFVMNRSCVRSAGSAGRVHNDAVLFFFPSPLWLKICGLPSALTLPVGNHQPDIAMVHGDGAWIIAILAKHFKAAYDEEDVDVKDVEEEGKSPGGGKDVQDKAVVEWTKDIEEEGKSPGGSEDQQDDVAKAMEGTQIAAETTSRSGKKTWTPRVCTQEEMDRDMAMYGVPTPTILWLQSKVGDGVDPEQHSDEMPEENGKNAEVKDILYQELYMSAQRRRRPPGWLEVTVLSSMDEFWQDLRSRDFRLFLGISECKGEAKFKPTTELKTVKAPPTAPSLPHRKKHRFRPLAFHNSFLDSAKLAPVQSKHTREVTAGRRRVDPWVSRLRKLQLKQLQLEAASRTTPSKIRRPKQTNDNADVAMPEGNFFELGGTNLWRANERKFRQNVSGRTHKELSACPDKASGKKRLPALKLYGGANLFVRTLTGFTMAFEIELTSSVQTLKELIRQRAVSEKLPAGISVEAQRLVTGLRDIGGRSTISNTRAISDFGIKAGATLTLLLRLQGGAMPEEETADAAGTEHVEDPRSSVHAEHPSSSAPAGTEVEGSSLMQGPFQSTYT